MLKRVSVKELSPGMFVEAIAEQTGNNRISQKGFVKSEASINQLKRSGVVAVIVDTAKVLSKNDVTDNEVIHLPEQPKKKLSGYSERIVKAKQLYKHAKELQVQAFRSISEGTAVNLEPFVELADQFIDSLFEDQDAVMFAAMIRNKDEYLLEHSINVSILLTSFARYLRLSDAEIRDLALGGFLHDIGKIKIDDAILLKPGRLTSQEYEEIKRHVEYGLDAVASMSELSPIARDVIALHHEKLDGTGYPYGLKNEQISFFGRMAAICDCYDAITANRCYKTAEASGKAFRILLAESGKHFDTELVGKFIKCLGVYPVGALVELASGKLGVVYQTNPGNPLRPKIKAFYNWKHKHFIEVREIDLAGTHQNDEIERAVRAESLGIDLPKFFDDFLA